MQIFTFHDVLRACWNGITAAWGLKGAIAESALNLVFLPFHELSFVSCIVAVVWVAFFWRNKSWLFSGISHLLDLAGIIVGLLSRVYTVLRFISL